VLERTAKSSRSVEDDGSGARITRSARGRTGEHYGLEIMRERARRIGPTSLVSAPGKGNAGVLHPAVPGTRTEP